MKDFLLQNWITMLVIAAFTYYVLHLVINKKWDQLRATAYRLILQAESVIRGTKRGQERFAAVFEQVYSLVPPWLKFLFPETLVKEKLQDWFNTIKDYLDNGSVDNSTNETNTVKII